ncbi:MAG: tyrosine-type recombinase/integrase [Alistipes sp.]|nr:tyrosine-type recombinase/integrase [Alistipes sp.]
MADHTYHQKPRGRRRTRSLQGRTQQRHLRPKIEGHRRLVRKKVPRQPRRNHHAARLLDILLNREPDAHITCVMLMLDTDMRRAEALGMTWSDVSVENRSILIEQQFAADRSVRSPKSKKSVRRISISETLTSYLEFWKKEQAREMEAFGLEQVKGTPLVHSFERTKDRHPQVNFMDLNGFSRWFRNFSVENGFGKFEGVRTYHYVKETVDGETISKRYEHKEWLELRDYLRKHPKVREARHISTYESEHLPYGYSGLSSHTATAATARYCPPASEPAGGSSTPNISPTAQRVVDLAAKADIEDVMLCDLPGVLSFLGLPPETEMPPGNKGKTKLKKLYRKVAPNKAYHSGERAKDLISHLDMAEIRASAPVQELGCSSIRARGSFRLDWGRMAGRKQFASGNKRTKAQFTS